MYRWARPQIAVPTHGERRHLLEHAAFARDLQVPQQVTPRNGDMVRLAPGRAGDHRRGARPAASTSTAAWSRPRTARPCASAATPPPTACSRSPSCWTARARSSPARRCAPSACPRDADYPLDDMLDDLADEAEQALEPPQGRGPRRRRGRGEPPCRARVKKASQRIWGRRPVVETTVLRLVGGVPAVDRRSDFIVRAGAAAYSYLGGDAVGPRARSDDRRPAGFSPWRRRAIKRGDLSRRVGRFESSRQWRAGSWIGRCH